MPRYSDAALLRGDFAHMAAELRAGKRAAPSPAEWQKTSCDNAAEVAAQAVAKQIFDLQSSLKGDEEQLEVATMSTAGPMIVMGLFTSEGDMVRLEGLLIASRQPVAQIIHSSQLSLTITKKAIAEAKPEEDAAQIGFVIFDQLAKRSKSKIAPKRKTVAKSKTTKSQASKTKASKR